MSGQGPQGFCKGYFADGPLEGQEIYFHTWEKVKNIQGIGVGPERQKGINYYKHPDRNSWHVEEQTSITLVKSYLCIDGPLAGCTFALLAEKTEAFFTFDGIHWREFDPLEWKGCAPFVYHTYYVKGDKYLTIYPPVRTKPVPFQDRLLLAMAKVLTRLIGRGTHEGRALQ